MLIPIKPMMDRSLFLKNSNDKLSQPWNSGSFYEKGREALVEGVRKVGLKKGDCIIVPALICYPVIEALRNEGYKVHLIDLNKNLSFPKTKISSLIYKKKAKALMLIDYFGFLAEENIEFSKYLKTKHKKIKIIIDRCHTSFFKRNIFLDLEKTDLIFFSLRKIIPTFDGGVYFTKKKEISEIIVRNKIFIIIFYLKRLIEDLIIMIGFPNIFINVFSKFTLLKNSKSVNPVINKNIITNMLYNQLTNRSQIDKIEKIRKKNYNLIHKVVIKNNITPLFNKLNKSISPQVFPVIDHSKKLNTYLRKMGVGSYNWPGCELPPEILRRKKEFKNSIELNSKLLCLPLHQSIKKEHIFYLNNILKKYDKILSRPKRNF